MTIIRAQVPMRQGGRAAMTNGNWNGNGGWPLSKKRLVRLLLGFTIIVWATQTLLSQWGLGQEPALTTPAPGKPIEHGEEKFVPGSARFAGGATLELRAEATVIGGEVALKQICRWSDADAAVFAPIAELTLARLGPAVPFRGISITDVKQTLRDAGVNIAAINFVGATSCTVGRSDVEFNEGEVLQQWVDAHEGRIGPTTDVASAPGATAAESGDSTPPTRQPDGGGTEPGNGTEQDGTARVEVRTLRAVLRSDLAQRLGFPEEQLQMSFRAQDERVLNLPDAHFGFDVDAKRARDLGEVTWTVAISPRGLGATDRSGAASAVDLATALRNGPRASTKGAGSPIRTIVVSATARAWQSQVVVTRPLGAKQIISDDAVVVRRALIERAPDDAVLTREQALGQQAARDLKPGTVLTGRLVDAVQLVRTGQFVTVVLKRGGVEIKTVARAMEGGAMGQTIRVKNETTREVLSAVVSGPQTVSLSPAGPSDVASAR